jgi:hypothetical protein
LYRLGSITAAEPGCIAGPRILSTRPAGLLEWRESRIRLSKAVYLRELQAAREEAIEAAT